MRGQAPASAIGLPLILWLNIGDHEIKQIEAPLWLARGLGLFNGMSLATSLHLRPS